MSKTNRTSDPKAVTASALETIARDCTPFKTLAVQNSDELDFQPVAVWELRAALEAAFQAGRASV